MAPTGSAPEIVEMSNPSIRAGGAGRPQSAASRSETRS